MIDQKDMNALRVLSSEIDDATRDALGNVLHHILQSLNHERFGKAKKIVEELVNVFRPR